jgi:hypothetical protein
VVLPGAPLVGSVSLVAVHAGVSLSPLRRGLEPTMTTSRIVEGGPDAPYDNVASLAAALAVVRMQKGRLTADEMREALDEAYRRGVRDGKRRWHGWLWVGRWVSALQGVGKRLSAVLRAWKGVGEHPDTPTTRRTAEGR